MEWIKKKLFSFLFYERERAATCALVYTYYNKTQVYVWLWGSFNSTGHYAWLYYTGQA